MDTCRGRLTRCERANVDLVAIGVIAVLVLGGIWLSEQPDTDNDGVKDWRDDCPSIFGTAVEPSGFRGCVDADGDGWADAVDAFPLLASEWLDTDADGVGDNEDAFPEDPSESVDTDDDGAGDNADIDADNDGLTDTEEAGIGTAANNSDTDGDGVGDAQDAFPLDANETVDTDGDGLGNNADLDDDNDTVLDEDDVFPLDATEWADRDNDSFGDNVDFAPGIDNILFVMLPFLCFVAMIGNHWWTFGDTATRLREAREGNEVLYQRYAVDQQLLTEDERRRVDGTWTRYNSFVGFLSPLAFTAVGLLYDAFVYDQAQSQIGSWFIGMAATSSLLVVALMAVSHHLRPRKAAMLEVMERMEEWKRNDEEERRIERNAERRARQQAKDEETALAVSKKLLPTVHGGFLNALSSAPLSLRTSKRKVMSVWSTLGKPKGTMPQRATFALWMAAETTDEEAWLKSVEENLVRFDRIESAYEEAVMWVFEDEKIRRDRVVVLEGMLARYDGTANTSVVRELIQRVMNGEDEEVVALDLGLFQL